MKYHEYYKSEIQEYLQNLKENEHTIVIFGASRAGWYIVKVLEHFDIPIKCFVDNDQTKLGTYHNYTVISTDDLAAAFPEATIFLISQPNSRANFLIDGVAYGFSLVVF